MKKEDAIGMGIGLTVIAGTTIFAAKELIRMEEQSRKELSAKDLISPFWRNRVRDLLDKLNQGT